MSHHIETLFLFRLLDLPSPKPPIQPIPLLYGSQTSTPN